MPQVNTGVVERRQRDVNPNSLTFGQLRWVNGGIDLVLCPISSVYESAQISQTVYRSDCGGGRSTGALYTMPAGHITDATSQADVDARARIEFASTKEAYALAHCTCSAPPAQPEVRVLSYAYNAGNTAVLITFQRSDTLGQLQIDYSYVFDGARFNERAYIPTGLYTVDAQVIPPISSSPGTPAVIDAVFINSTTPSNYLIVS